MRGRPLRIVPRVPRRLPDRGVGRAAPPRRPEVPQLSHDRTARSDAGGASRGLRPPAFRLRRLPRGVPLESPHAGDRGAGVSARPGHESGRTGRLGAHWTRRRSATVFATRRCGGRSARAFCGTPAAARSSRRTEKSSARVPLLRRSSAGRPGYRPHCFCEAVAHRQDAAVHATA